MMNTIDVIDECAMRIFDYEHVDDELEACDGIVAFGSHDIHVAEHAARLFLHGWGEYVVFSGGCGRITRGLWNRPEAEVFASVARELGVPDGAVFVESRSSNTGENISFSRLLMEENGLPSSKLLVVDRPYRLRRTKAALAAQWQGPRFVMSSPGMGYWDYCDWYEGDGPIAKADFISLLVGDLQRIDVYGKRGFQAEQDIPAEVVDAYDYLVGQGFTSQMLAV